MNASPATVAFKSFAAQSVHAAAVVNEVGADPWSHSLYTTPEEPELEPGSRIVSDAEVKAATGAELQGWLEAAKKEFLNLSWQWEPLPQRCHVTSRVRVFRARLCR